MCASCFQYHERFKALRGHRSVLTDKLQTQDVLDPKTDHVFTVISRRSTIVILLQRL